MPLLMFSLLRLDAQRPQPDDGDTAPFDVLHYDARIEPDIAAKTLTGSVAIRFAALAEALTTIELDCGDLSIDAVTEGPDTLKFERRDRRLSIQLRRAAKTGETRDISIDYHGAPRFGIQFFPDRTQVYTVFTTSQWMVCVDAPDDRATLRLKVLLPKGLRMAANGRLASQKDQPNGKIAFDWQQDAAVPTYTFGFAAGRFQEVTEQSGGIRLRYLAASFSDSQLRRIFRLTSDMIRFYEERAGVRYGGKTYTQVLAAGRVAQEMSGFTAIRESYGNEVLADETAVWLGAHELAHQWWGNQVTCRDWRHFWLNEGMANFMTAAYGEHRFGRQMYDRDIERSRLGYQKVRDKGKDRPLVFPDWLHPTADDRTIVYDKGAYVLHLLRTELGEDAFWAGIRDYTRRYFGKSVTTADFQKAMEESSGKNLGAFFARWGY